MNVFIGHYHQVLAAFHNKAEVELVIVERGKECATSVLEYAESNKIPAIEVINSRDLDDALGSKEVCLAVVASFGIILKNRAIQACRCIVNFHPGDVERVRGRHPLPQTILNGDPDMVISAHLINSDAIDAGPILGRLFLPIDYSDDYASNYQCLLDSLESFSGTILSRVFKGNFQVRSQCPGVETYFPPLSEHVLSEITGARNLLDYIR